MAHARFWYPSRAKGSHCPPGAARDRARRQVSGYQTRLPFHVASEGERVTGVFTGTTQLEVEANTPSSRILNEFTLVPWRSIMDERLGRQISGIVLGSAGISWDFEAKTHARSPSEMRARNVRRTDDKWDKVLIASFG